MTPDYNALNAHSRDAALEFDADTHTYRLGGRECLPVTALIDSLFEQFDAEYWAARKATPERPAHVILAEWEARGQAARDAGTVMHDRIERYYLGQNTEAWLTDGAFRHFCAFTWEHSLMPFRSEWRIYHDEALLAGTLDFLALNPDGSFDIWDWKRSTKVVDFQGNPITANTWGNTAYDPISHVPDTAYWHYALQLSIYRYILENKYDMEIRDCYLGVFHPDNPRHYVVKVPYLEHEVEAVLARRM